MPLMNITFPQNAATFYGFIASVAAFDILPTEKIESYIFNFTTVEQTDLNFD